MSEKSPWAAPEKTQPSLSHEAQLQAMYGEDDNPDDIDDMKMVFNGEKDAEAAQTAEVSAADFSVGQEVSVERGKEKTIEGGWKIVETGIQMELPDDKGTLTVVKVEKPTDDGTKMQEKLISVDALKRIQREAEAQQSSELEPEQRADIARDLGEDALETIGVVDPSSDVEQSVDEQARHYSREDIKKMRAEALNRQDIPSVAEVQPESEVEMQERFVRETKAELDDLYAQLRSAKPGSYESDSLTNQINNTKQDLGERSKKLARLRGSTVWH